MKLIIDIPEDRYKDVIEARKHHLLDSYAQAVASGIPLDKIRAEIDEQKNHRFFDDDDMCIYKAGLIDALEIIDKYRNEVSHGI